MRRMVMVAVAAALVVAGCGGDDGGGDAGAGGGDQTTAVAPTTGGTDTTAGGGDLTLPPMGADDTFEVRVVNLFGGTDGRGEAIDVWAQDPDDLKQVTKVIAGLAYGAISDPVPVPVLMDDTPLLIFPAGAPAPKDRFDTAGALGRVSADPPEGGEDAFVVVYEDVIGGKAEVRYQTQDQLRSGTPNEAGKSSFVIASISFEGVIDQAWTAVLDGTCLDTADVYNDTIVPVAPGTHTLEIRDLSASRCDAAPAVLPPVSFEATAGTRTIVALKGADAATASLVTFAVGLG